MITLFNSNSGFFSIDMVTYLLAYVMALFVAMPFHEFAHAFVAKKEGDYTSVALKRCTLAPLAHVDLAGLACLFFLGFGWAKPVPVDERNFKRGKLSKFLVAIAGIVTNLALGTIFMFIYILIIKIDPNIYLTTIYGSLLHQFLILSISLNFSLAFFNLLPIYPLDGFRIIEAFSRWDSQFVNFMKRYSTFIFIAVIISGVYIYYFEYTAQFCITYLFKLFYRLLGV